MKNNIREKFGSKFGFIAAAAGSAVGLGNIWKFPYVAGVHGGAAFLIIYLICIFVIGFPVMLSEFIIGRNAQSNAIGAFKRLAPDRYWYLIGWMGIVSAFFILAFYSVVAGWTINYILKSLANSFSMQTSSELAAMFESLVQKVYEPIFWQIIFMFLTGWIVYAGIKNGIEKYAKIMMPLLFIIIIILDIRAITLPESIEGLKFLFKPQWSEINTNTIIVALGQAFFSLSLGMGTMITYASYISKKENLGETAVQVTLTDTLVALLAGVAIFPAVFALGIEPDFGPGLVFITVPNVFSQIPGGYFFTIIFFILLAIAALTSSISILEVVVAFLVEEVNITRNKATVLTTIAITLLGIPCSLSQGILAKQTIFGLNFFDLLDYISSNILLPLGGLLIILFVGWFWDIDKVKYELTNNGHLDAKYITLFLILAKYIAPIAIVMVFLNGLGLLSFN